MVGKRRETGALRVKDARPLRRRANLNVRLAQTHEPRERVAMAAAYLRSALALNPDPAVSEAVVTHLIETADRLFNRKEANK